MEKRFVLFLILSFALMTGYIMLQSALAPPAPPAAEQAEADNPPGGPADDPAADPEPDEKQPGEPPGGVEQAQGDAGLTGPGPAVAGKADPQAPLAEAPELAAGQPGPDEQLRSIRPPQWATLQAPTGNLRVTFTNQGAGVVSLELIEVDRRGRLRYRSMDDTRAYLGAVILADAVEGGALVRYTPPGSPAAEADLRADDVVLMLGEKPVADEADLQRQLTHVKSGDTVVLTVRRQVAGQPKEAVLTVHTEQRPLALIEPDRDKDLRLLNNPASFRMEITRFGGLEVDPGSPRFGVLERLVNDNWDMEMRQGPEPAVEFSYSMSAQQLAPLGFTGPLEVVKRFKLSNPEASDDPQYHLTWEVEFRNGGSDDLKLAYAIWGGNGLTTEGWWYQNKLHPRMFSVAGARDVVTGYARGGFQLLSVRDIHSQALKRPVSPRSVLFASTEPADQRARRYLAGDTQYFAVALLPPAFGNGETLQFASADAFSIGGPLEDRYRIKLENTTFRAVSEPLTVAAQQQHVDQFAIFCGPKREDLLARYGLSDLIYRGWFAVFSKAASWILHVLYAIVRNYGLAIILLTVLVRGMMFPIGRKAAMNAQKMQELAPEIKRINEKYKSDVQKRGEEMGALYKRHNFNPMSGCGLMFFQLPVFLGLYRCLAVDIELRQASFIPGLEWCSNLAGPDQLWNWSEFMPDMVADEGAGYLGPYFNLLPILTIGLFLVQQKMFTPPATDDQSRMQQQMMKFMMIFFGVMFFKVPAGLCIYFIASSLWGIAERKLLPKPAAKDLKKEQQVQKTVEAKKARLKANKRK